MQLSRSETRSAAARPLNVVQVVLSLDTGGQDAFPASLVDGRVCGVDGRYFEPFQAGSNGRRQSGGSASDY